MSLRADRGHASPHIQPQLARRQGQGPGTKSPPRPQRSRCVAAPVQTPALGAVPASRNWALSVHSTAALAPVLRAKSRVPATTQGKRDSLRRTRPGDLAPASTLRNGDQAAFTPGSSPSPQ